MQRGLRDQDAAGVAFGVAERVGRQCVGPAGALGGDAGGDRVVVVAEHHAGVVVQDVEAAVGLDRPADEGVVVAGAAAVEIYSAFVYRGPTVAREINRELVARLKAVLRRAGPTDSEGPIEVGGLLLDPISHRVTIDGKPAEMGPTEYRLLQFFMTHQERAYTRGQLLDQVWGGNVYVEERTVDVHIRRLRKALGETCENLVQTVRGTGYRFSTKS